MAGDKYIVFKREDFYILLGELGLPPYYPNPGTIGEQGESAGTDWDCAPIAQHIEARAAAVEIQDAVVIRRQDVFAPVPLESYACAVKLALSLAEKSPVTENLSKISNYFYEQAGLSWATNRKIPD